MTGQDSRGILAGGTGWGGERWEGLSDYCTSEDPSPPFFNSSAF